jgi:sporulation protein YunB
MIYLSQKQRRGISLFSLILLICASMTAAVYYVNKSLAPSALILAKANAERVANVTLNDAVTRVMSEEQTDYRALVDIQKNEGGDITSIESNTVMMNRLKAKLSAQIQDGITNIDSVDLSVPAGNLSGFLMLAGRGPKIPVSLLSAGDVHVDFVNAFSHAGINQTKHEVSLHVRIRVSVVLPSGSETVELTSAVPVAETIIVGKVPEVFFQT